MNISWKWIGVILALCLGVVYFANSAHVARVERNAAMEQLEKAQKRIVSIQAQVQKSTSRSQQARHTVKEKLDEAPAFRDTAVPVPVRDSLCQHLRCK